MNSTLEHPPPGGPEKGVESKPTPEPPPPRPWYSPSTLWQRKTTIIAAFSIAAIVVHLVLRFGFRAAPGTYEMPLLATLILGGLPLLYDLLRKLLKTPVAGAITQEVIDVLAVLNALRAAFPPKVIHDL